MDRVMQESEKRRHVKIVFTNSGQLVSMLSLPREGREASWGVALTIRRREVCACPKPRQGVNELQSVKRQFC